MCNSQTTTKLFQDTKINRKAYNLIMDIRVPTIYNKHSLQSMETFCDNRNLI